MALWCLLFYSRNVELTSLQICGDSKFIIDWLANQCKLQVASLIGWKRWTRQLLDEFREVDIKHICREYNVEADTLSKRALHLEEGNIYVEEYWEDNLLLALVLNGYRL